MSIVREGGQIRQVFSPQRFTQFERQSGCSVDAFLASPPKLKSEVEVLALSALQAAREKHGPSLTLPEVQTELEYEYLETLATVVPLTQAAGALETAGSMSVLATTISAVIAAAVQHPVAYAATALLGMATAWTFQRLDKAESLAQPADKDAALERGAGAILEQWNQQRF